MKLLLILSLAGLALAANISLQGSNLLGEVISETESDNAFHVDLRNPGEDDARGFLKVKIDSSTRLVDPRGKPFDSTAQFFLALEMGDFVEIRCVAVNGGMMQASFVKISAF